MLVVSSWLLGEDVLPKLVNLMLNHSQSCLCSLKYFSHHFCGVVLFASAASSVAVPCSSVPQM